MKTQFDLCVIGGGSGGLSVAAAASQMGLRVLLIEKNKMGGDCLNTGCVPSKSLLAAAKRAAMIRKGGVFGIQAAEPQVDYLALRNYIHQVIASIAPQDSIERFTDLGVTVRIGAARFVRPNAIQVNEETFCAKRFVIATGSHPVAPPIPGLDMISYLTNETIFDLDQQPEHLIVIGGGPIGCELAQAHCLLGTKVTLLEAFKLLPKDDPECVDIVRQQLLSSGVDIKESIEVKQVRSDKNKITVTLKEKDKEYSVHGSHLLVAAGRRANTEGLQLEKAQVQYDKKGITVDTRLRTTNKKIYAIGDVSGGYQFTHVAAYQAGIVIRNALFHWSARVDYSRIPWVTYTAPELAQVGLNEAMAQEQGVACEILRCPLSEVDRARAEDEIEGMIKVLVTRRGYILGVTIVGAEAGEMILPWVLAMQQGLRLSAVASLIVPYPTRNDLSKRVASQFYARWLYSPRMQRIVRFLSKF